jgi:hypothetical protein
MDFQQLQALGGIVPTALVKKEIEFTRPRTPDEGEGEPVRERVDIFVRKRTSRDFLEINRATDGDRPFVALFRSVCLEDGTPLFPSIDDASRLAEWLLGPMLNAVNEVNAFAPKPSPPRTSSGIGSRSPSAAEASASGSSRSTKRSVRRGSRTSASTAPSNP